MDDQRIQIPGSSPKAQGEARWSSAADAGQAVEATVLLRRHGGRAQSQEIGQQLLSGELRSMAREDALQAMSADPNDVAAVRSFLRHYGLSIDSESLEARNIKIHGTAAQMDEAFSIQLGWFEDADGQRYLSYQGQLSVPESISGIVIAVVGLDQRPVAKHHTAS